MKSCCGDRYGGAAIAAALAAIVADFASIPEPAPAPAGPSITADMLVGNWGLASYHWL